MNNNIMNDNRRFKSLHNNNLFNKESLKNLEKKYTIFSNENKRSVNINRDNKKNIMLNYKNTFKQKLPILRVNKKSLLTN